MASGSYVRKATRQLPLEERIASQIPARATRQLQEVVQKSVPDDAYDEPETTSVGLVSRPLPDRVLTSASPQRPPFPRAQAVAIMPLRQPPAIVVHPWLKPWVVSLIIVICFLLLLLSAGIFQRPFSSYILNGGLAYDGQVGGDQADSWQHPPNTKIVPQSGPYMVLGKPSINVDFINQVLSTYQSPAAGKGQALYDLGVQYGVDPAFALAFFMHESTFGTKGEATKSLSLGNLRCIPNFRCEDNFAQFDTWEDGFQAWYQLIRNLYVAQWQLTTVDQIIPRYAPQADHNNEAAYIGSLKHAIDTWHAGQIVVR